MTGRRACARNRAGMAVGAPLLQVRLQLSEMPGSDLLQDHDVGILAEEEAGDGLHGLEGHVERHNLDLALARARQGLARRGPLGRLRRPQEREHQQNGVEAR